MKRIIYLALLVSFAGGCSKEKTKDIMYFKIHPEALKYIKFDQGKYYIYKDSATGRLDSVILTDNTLTTKHIPASQGSWANTPEYNTEHIQMTLHRYGDNVGTQWFKAEGEPMLQNYYGPFLSDDSASIILTEIISWQGGVRTSHGAFSSTSTAFPMIVEAVSYPSVILGGFSSPTFYENSLREFYWAKNVGIIKKIIVLENVRYVSSLVRHGQN
jgi:hypothetical protein